jgi:hypothetical protein
VNRRLETAGSTASTGSGGEDCSQIAWLRWTGGTSGARGGAGGSPIVNIWTFVGNVGVTLMIFQSGMHIHFDKVAQVGRKAFVVAIFGTALPLLTGMAVVGGLTGEYYPSGFAAGCAFAPTSIDISIKLLDESKMLNSLAGQTTLTAACVGMVRGRPSHLGGATAHYSSLLGLTLPAPGCFAESARAAEPPRAQREAAARR